MANKTLCEFVQLEEYLPISLVEIQKFLIWITDFKLAHDVKVSGRQSWSYPANSVQWTF